MWMNIGVANLLGLTSGDQERLATPTVRNLMPWRAYRPPSRCWWRWHDIRAAAGRHLGPDRDDHPVAEALVNSEAFPTQRHSPARCARSALTRSPRGPA